MRSTFERAAELVVNGDVNGLGKLLDRHPQLVRQHSRRAHRATLLHYVSANGVEDERQRIPPTIYDISYLLLDRGAEPDALSKSYGGGPSATTLNLLLSSVHPARAGVQTSLADILISYGAAIEGPEGRGSPLLMALSFFYPAAAQALVERGARVSSIIAAAGVGRVDLVRRYLRRPSPPLPLALRGGLHLRAGSRAERERALVLAAALGHADVVELLVDRGVRVDARDHQGMTGLHWAANRGELGVMQVLLSRGASMSIRNRYGGTVRGFAEWSRHNVDGVFTSAGWRRVDYRRVMELLGSKD